MRLLAPRSATIGDRAGYLVALLSAIALVVTMAAMLSFLSLYV